jgi:hypothetical protein
MRNKRKYMNGQPRGGTPGKATNTECPEGRTPKDYHRIAVAFHGGELAHEKWVKGGRRGYRVA